MAIPQHPDWTLPNPDALLDPDGPPLPDTESLLSEVLCEVLGRVTVWRATAPEGAAPTLDGLRAALDAAVREPGRWHELSHRLELAA